MELSKKIGKLVINYDEMFALLGKVVIKYDEILALFCNKVAKFSTFQDWRSMGQVR